MGLHVGVFGAKKLFNAVAGQIFGLVDDFAAAVIALCRVTFGVFVG